MKADERRSNIIEMLMKEKRAIKGTTLAESFNVTRQIIVKDIAILRAKGNNIIATPDGYMINEDNSNRVKSVIAVNHNDEEVIKELEIVVKYGGIIEDVIVEHPLYGEIRGILMIKNLNDLNKFKNSLNQIDAKPLSMLTNGVHLHTISADSVENISPAAHLHFCIQAPWKRRDMYITDCSYRLKDYLPKTAKLIFHSENMSHFPTFSQTHLHTLS